MLDITTNFDRLQLKLIEMWRSIGSTLDDPPPDNRYEDNHTVVVVPSMGFDLPLTSSGQQAYEERMLFMLFLLRKPGIRLIYATSQPIQPAIIDYYLETLPGLVSSNTRKRLFLVSPEDGRSDKTLSEKLLDRPHLIQHMRNLIPDRNRAHMVPFTTTDAERQLSVRLGLPMYAADPRYVAFGTKSGCRQVFEQEGVMHPLGYEHLHSEDDLLKAIAGIRQHRPTVTHVVVKLNEGVSGLGNALVNLTGLPAPGADDEQTAIAARLQALTFEDADATYADYIDKLTQHGAIVEEYLIGPEGVADAVRSPSAQLRVTPLGTVEMLSTHDQILGGPSGQSYIGAAFPADAAYSWAIMQDAVKVGQRFAREGIVGRFAMDFVTVRQADGGWQHYAIEVNLRKGGTTAPFLILQYLTDGTYDAEQSVFTTAQGHQKYYVASDHVEKEAYRAFTIDHLFDIVSNHHLHFNHATQTGVVMHMLTGVAELGRVGVTAIADSPDEARALYDRFVQVLDDEAAALTSVKFTNEMV